jgi:putative effector of murein hydrolase LrgA (UPF0299 family)
MPLANVVLLFTPNIRWAKMGRNLVLQNRNFYFWARLDSFICVFGVMGQSNRLVAKKKKKKRKKKKRET